MLNALLDACAEMYWIRELPRGTPQAIVGEELAAVRVLVPEAVELPEDLRLKELHLSAGSVPIDPFALLPVLRVPVTVEIWLKDIPGCEFCDCVLFDAFAVCKAAVLTVATLAGCIAALGV